MYIGSISSEAEKIPGSYYRGDIGQEHADRLAKVRTTLQGTVTIENKNFYARQINRCIEVPSLSGAIGTMFMDVVVYPNAKGVNQIRCMAIQGCARKPNGKAESEVIQKWSKYYSCDKVGHVNLQFPHQNPPAQTEPVMGWRTCVPVPNPIIRVE